jgi:dephospho-CoA kinase
MKVIGLTGSIGMGKSTTAAMFLDLGVPVYDSDAAVADLYAVGGTAVAPVGEAFPGSVKNGCVDREALRRQVLGNPEALARLNAIVHPLVREDRDRFFRAAEAQGAEMVLVDIPLLFETGAQTEMDAVVVASAPAHIQRERVLARPGMTPERLDAILAAQMHDAENAPAPTMWSRLARAWRRRAGRWRRSSRPCGKTEEIGDDSTRPDVQGKPAATAAGR